METQGAFSSFGALKGNLSSWLGQTRPSNILFNLLRTLFDFDKITNTNPMLRCMAAPY